LSQAYIDKEKSNLLNLKVTGNVLIKGYLITLSLESVETKTTLHEEERLLHKFKTDNDGPAEILPTCGIV
jgi:hypothetical protein